MAQLNRLRYGVVANIIASHAIARGSIPRVGMKSYSGCVLVVHLLFKRQK